MVLREGEDKKVLNQDPSHDHADMITMKTFIDCVLREREQYMLQTMYSTEKCKGGVQCNKSLINRIYCVLLSVRANT